MRFIGYFLYFLSFYGPYVVTSFTFGDSYMDVGNAILLPSFGSSLPANKLAYGENYSNHNPNGRWSNGLILPDLFNQDIVPYLSITQGEQFETHLNFAIAGSTSLNKSTLLSFDIVTPNITDLATQVTWFEISCSNNPGCYSRQSNFYYIFGTFGGMDIIYSVTQGKTFDEIMNMIPFMVEAIRRGILELISQGATKIIVPLNFPLGCFPVIINNCHGITLLDQYGCIEGVNNLTMYLNSLVQSSVDDINKNHNMQITTPDFYTALLNIIVDPSSKGFDSDTILKSCCGNGIFNLSDQFCSGTKASTCDIPDKYIHWDGINLTQPAYEIIMNAFN